MTQLKPGGNPSFLSFWEDAFWVHILDAPFEWYNKKMAEWLASQIGN